MIISTWSPRANNPNPPLHAKACARAVFDDTIVQFVDSMQMEGVPTKAVSAESVDFDF